MSAQVAEGVEPSHDQGTLDRRRRLDTHQHGHQVRTSELELDSLVSSRKDWEAVQRKVTFTLVMSNSLDGTTT